MKNVPHTPASEQCHHLVADLDGDRDTTPTASPALDWPQAVAQVSTALCAKLRLEVPPERIQKALDLVLAHAVTIYDDGSASVQSGTTTSTLAPHCSCADAQHRPELCKHTIAVELHRRALQRVAAPAPPASASAAPPSAAPPPPSTPPPASVSGTAAWLVQEAPTSACFKWRVGDAELMYTFRGVTDDEVLARIRETLPLLQDIVAACTASATARYTAPAPPDAPDEPAPHQLARPQAQAAPRHGNATTNGHANGQRQRPTGDQETGWCSLHGVEMQQHVNDRGTWYSHTIGKGSYCKGAK